MPNKIPMPSGFSNSKIDEEQLKNYTIKDLAWAFKILNSFREAKESLLDIMKALADAGVDTSKINWNDPFSIMNAFLQVKEVDIDYVIEKMGEIEDVSFADINRALDVVETFLALSSRAEKIAKSMSKRRYTAKEFDMLMSLFGLGGSGSKVKIDVEDVSDEIEEEESITDDELDRIKDIINKYRHGSGSQ